MSRLLFSESDTLVINPQLAKLIGLNEAIILQQIHYWIDNKYCAGHIHLGRKWIYNTVSQWHEQFPFMSVSTIKRAMVDLRDKGLIDVQKLSKDGLNHTNYYTVNYDQIDALKAQIDLTDKVKMSQSSGSDWSKPNRTETTTKTTRKQPRASLADVGGEKFDIFWKDYPSKVGKDAARKAFAKRKFDEKTFAQVLQALELQKVSERWTKDNGQYIPNPATWLNQGRWEDEVPGSTPGSDNTAFVGII